MDVGRLVLMAIPLGIIVYAFIDVLMARPHTTRLAPKWLWAVAVLVLPLLGAVLWFVLGRPKRRPGPYRSPGVGPSARRRDARPDDDPDFLATLDPTIHRRPHLRASIRRRTTRTDPDGTLSATGLPP